MLYQITHPSHSVTPQKIVGQYKNWETCLNIKWALNAMYYVNPETLIVHKYELLYNTKQ